MRVIFLLIALCALVDGNCEFKTNDSIILRDKMKERGVYNRTFILPTKTSTYYIGICTLPNNSFPNGAIIQQEKNDFYVLGQLNQVNLAGGDDWILLTYENGTQYNHVCGNKTRSVSVIFICGKNTDNITVVQEHTSEDSHCNYMFQFQGFGMCPIVSQEKKKLSGGAIFLIILLCLTSTYLIGGFLFMRIKRGARGIDQIPNVEMWRKLGNFAADGCDYCCRCNTNAPRAGYFIDESEPDMRGDDDILAP